MLFRASSNTGQGVSPSNLKLPLRSNAIKGLPSLTCPLYEVLQRELVWDPCVIGHGPRGRVLGRVHPRRAKVEAEAVAS